MNRIYTVGHSSHRLEQVLSLLKQHEITAVTDVRSSPYSQRNSQFNREALADELKGVGIAYVFLGKELGARSQDPSCYVDGQARYELISETLLYRQGLARVLRGAERYRIALMCAEADPVTCHRAVLVSRSLGRMGLEIAHIHSSGRLETQNELEERLLRITGFSQADLFPSRNALERAYEMQGRKIAYVKPPLAYSPPDSGRD